MARLLYGSDFALARVRRRLPVFLALSVILHVVIAALPRVPTSAVVAPEPLAVTLKKEEPVRIAPPQPIPEPPARRERVSEAPKPKPKPAPQRKIAQPEPPSPAAAPPVVALPQTQNAPDTSAPLPAQQPEEKPAVAAREEKPGPAPTPSASRPSAAPEPAVAEKTTPPISDAAYLKNPRPLYPMSARRRGIEGTVLLKVLVTREGSAASVSVEKSSGSTSLDEAALEAVRKWRFVPARRGAQPVEAWHVVPIVFRLEGAS